MNCYKAPELIAGGQIFRCEIQLMTFVILGYFLHSLELGKFLDKEIATK